ncbi:phosphoribosyl-ATP pyrophosphohydrolase [Candidatus Saccharibacteria bacterium]|nr:MAG: phosphoribosyl-ATP pyrophosphohydrolase [Candidatus Saccharibacteria bacterium]
MPIYNKLVRDNIPQIIASSGRKARCTTLNDADYARELVKKLSEEVAEYVSDGSIEGLADVLEVVYALAAAQGCTLKQLEEARLQKARQRGAFRDKVFLVRVDD